jgi:hypothetical protein
MKPTELKIILPPNTTIEQEENVLESIQKSFSPGGELYKALKVGGPSHAGLSASEVKARMDAAMGRAHKIADDMEEKLTEVKEAWEASNSLAQMARQVSKVAETKERVETNLDKIYKPLDRQARQALREAYNDIFDCGKQAYGNMTPKTHDEQLWLTELQRSKQQFFANFMKDMRQSVGKMSYDQRLGLYKQDLYSAYWAGWTFADLSSGRYVRWVKSESESCATCAALSVGGKWKNGIYTAQELAKRSVFPASGGLPCRTNCKCHLENVEKPLGKMLEPDAPVLHAIPKPKKKESPDSFVGQNRTERENLLKLVRRYGSKTWKKRKARPTKKKAVA